MVSDIHAVLKTTGTPLARAAIRAGAPKAPKPNVPGMISSAVTPSLSRETLNTGRSATQTLQKAPNLLKSMPMNFHGGGVGLVAAGAGGLIAAGTAGTPTAKPAASSECTTCHAVGCGCESCLLDNFTDQAFMFYMTPEAEAKYEKLFRKASRGDTLTDLEKDELGQEVVDNIAKGITYEAYLKERNRRLAVAATLGVVAGATLLLSKKK